MVYICQVSRYQNWRAVRDRICSLQESDLCMERLVSLPDSLHRDITVVAYHEAGHAVMARLMGRRVHDICLLLNVQGTYNGQTHWGRDEFFREWDSHLPYGELGLQQAEAKNGAALVIASGRAAERLWYRQYGLDEALASFGSSRANDDEVELESELFHTYPRLTPEQLPEAKHTLEELAMRLLGAQLCWQAVEAIAQALVQGVAHKGVHLVIGQKSSFSGTAV